MHVADVVAVVEHWLDALNRQDFVQLCALSNPDIEIVGPRGVARGLGPLHDWLGRAGLTLATKQIYARGNAVVVAQQGVWRSLETGEVRGEAAVASAFLVKGEKIMRVARFDSLGLALREAGLNAADAV